MTDIQNQISKLTEEFHDASFELIEKIFKGHQTLSEVNEVKLAETPKTLVWSRDKVKLFHYHGNDKKKVQTPLLIVYALVNRPDMLDLQPDRSVVKNLLDQGIDCYIVDWGYPTRVDRFNKMEDYIQGYLDDCVEFIRKEHKLPKINIMGICQGGTFSTIYSAVYPQKIKNLITLVTPIDFSTEDGLLFRWSRGINVDSLVDGYGGLVPGEFLNFGFDLLKPMGRLRKMQNLMDNLEDKSRLENFLRMEKWINDSPDQAGECYKQFVKEFYQGNKLIKGEFMLDHTKVDLKNLTSPLLNIYATEDHLVPPSASIPLNDYVGTKDKELLAIPGGHIGVFVGGRAQKILAPTIFEWLLKRDK